MEQLNTQTIVTNFNSPLQTYQSGGQFKIEVPQSSVMVSKPLSYNFRVVEYTDNKENIVKVGLQFCVFEHDNYGVRQLRQNWTDVERIRLPIIE